MGSDIYGMIEQPRVERGFWHNAGHVAGIAGDLANIGGTVYTIANQPNVEAPLLSSRTSSRLPSRTNTMHPLEMAHMGTEIISGLGNTAAGMYSQIMQGQAAAAQQQYYQ